MSTINKISSFVFAFLVIALPVKWVYAQIEVPKASPEGSVSTVVGLTNISVDYFRPKMRSRSIFGDGDGFLVPYGKIWRTGANSGTVIKFSDDVKVQGSPVAKGHYLIFSWPGATEWAIALYKDLSIGGNTSKYDRTNEVISFKVKPEKLAKSVETFTINITDIADNNEHANVQMAWENVSVKFSVTVDYDDQVMSAIEATNMTEHPESYVVAARYYYSKKRHLDQALVWIDKYLAMEDKGNEFFNLYLKAQIQRALYDKKGAMATARRALELAKRAAPNDFGYVEQIGDLISTLK